MAKTTRTSRPPAKPRKPRSSSRTTAPTPSQSKTDKLIATLSTPKGASLADLVAATGWRPHSVRGAISGTLKKKRQLKISSALRNGVRIYRLEPSK